MPRKKIELLAGRYFLDLDSLDDGKVECLIPVLEISGITGTMVEGSDREGSIIYIKNSVEPFVVSQTKEEIINILRGILL